MIEYWIFGATAEGTECPPEHGMTTFCVQEVINAYVRKHPDCVKVWLDVTLNVMNHVKLN